MAKTAKTTTASRRPYTYKKVGENLYRLQETGGYYALLKRGGKQIRRSLKTTDRALAKRRLADLKKQINRLNNSSDFAKATFREFAKHWLEAASVNLKQKTVVRIENCISAIDPFVGALAVRNVAYRNCENWMIKRGKNVSASTYKQERRILITILNTAVRDGIILDNPAENLPTRKIGKPQIFIPEKEQFLQLVQTMRQADIRGHHGANLVELLAHSGMRLGEAINLRWSDVDFKRGCFTVTGGEYGTKNHEARTVPLFPEMRRLLEEIKTSVEVDTKDDLVTPIKGTRTLMTNACKKANLPDFTHHCLRHYFCSNAIEAGIDFKVIAGWLGHKDGGVLVARTYGHLRDTHSFDMAKRMTPHSGIAHSTVNGRGNISA